MASGDPYQKAQPGEKLAIYAKTWNEVVDLVRPSAEAIPGREFSYRHINFRVYCKNDTESDIPRWAVLKIHDTLPSVTGVTGAAADQFESSPAVVGRKPDGEGARGFVVAVEPIKSASVGLAAIAGVVQARVQMLCDSHRYAKTKSNQTNYLESDIQGPFRILWKGSTGPTPTGATGPGAPWALVMFAAGNPLEDARDYSTGATQLLGHAAISGATGCSNELAWFSVTECDGVPSYSSSYFF